MEEIKIIKKNRDRLFAEAKSMIKAPDKQKESILYHHIFSLKMNESYVLETQEDVDDLVRFLNSTY